MEPSLPTSLSRKRSASNQSSPVQETRCIPKAEEDDDRDLLRDTPHDVPHVNDHSQGRPAKRPRLSLESARSDPASRSRKSPPSRRRHSPKPTPPLKHDVKSPDSPLEQQYLLHRQKPLPSTNESLLSPLNECPTHNLVLIPRYDELRNTEVTYIPARLPPVTRNTLRELDLDVILRNPQLRHDLLFDPGLQFRPNSGRRKQVATDHYWIAVVHELEEECVCSAWDAKFEPLDCCCPKPDPPPKVRRRLPTPPPWARVETRRYLKAAATSSYIGGPFEEEAGQEEGKTQLDRDIDVSSTRRVQRVLLMLQELVAVIKTVIVPSPSATTPSVPAYSASSPQAANDAANLLSHFDIELMHQELKLGIFEPAGLFKLVGDTLKRYCAPMRDSQIEAMVQAAKEPGKTATQRALSTIRLCFEIMELMKLDIANHQLVYLRNFFASSTPNFELQIFFERCRRGRTSPRVAKEWLQNSWNKIKKNLGAPMPHRRMLVHLSLIDAVTGLVFNPPLTPVSVLPSASPASGYPETLYLDTARVALLASDAADLTALYMLLMLWRQLIYWSPNSQNQETKQEDVTEDDFPRFSRGSRRLEGWEVDRMKREIWEVGPRRIGSCFFFPDDVNEKNAESMGEDRKIWTQAMQNAALQIALRAEEARVCAWSTPQVTPEVTSGANRLPSKTALEVMKGWIQSHMRRDSALAMRLRELLRQEVADCVTQAITYVVNTRMSSVPGWLGMKDNIHNFIPESGGGTATAGLEPLMPEIRHLAQRLAKLVLVNMRVYWSLYEAEGFLEE